MVESDIAEHTAERCELQNRLLPQGGAVAMQQGRKRRGDNDIDGATFCATVASQQQCLGARGSVVVKALCCKPEGRGFKPR
jgi:hypothetical protein